jgi:hypothetical protein
MTVWSYGIAMAILMLFNVIQLLAGALKHTPNIWNDPVELRVCNFWFARRWIVRVRYHIRYHQKKREKKLMKKRCELLICRLLEEPLYWDESHDSLSLNR